MDSARAAQKRRKTLTPEQLAIERDVTRKSLGLIPMADLRAMKAAHKRQEERDKQRADAKGSVADPLEIDNDNDEEENDKTATDENLEKTGPFDSRYRATCSLVWKIVKGCIGTNNNINRSDVNM